MNGQRAQLLVDGMDISRLVRRYRIEHEGGDLPRLTVEFIAGAAMAAADHGVVEVLADVISRADTFKHPHGGYITIHNQGAQRIRAVPRADGSGSIDVYIGEPSEN